MGTYRPTGLRALAPVSLTAFAVVFLIVIVSSLDNGSPSKDRSGPSPATRTVQRQSRSPQQTQIQGSRRIYVVKEGDTLVKIAEKTGVSIEQLLSLNPSIDPQGLVSGQRVKLRE